MPSVTVAVKVAPVKKEKLMELVNKGFYKNISEAVNASIDMVLNEYGRGNGVVSLKIPLKKLEMIKKLVEKGYYRNIEEAILMFIERGLQDYGGGSTA